MKIVNNNIKRKYILEQLALETNKNKETISVELDKDLLENLKNEAVEMETTVEDFIVEILIEKILEIKKESLNKDLSSIYDEVIDIYDFYKIEELIDSEKTYLVTTMKEPVVLIPEKKYNTLYKNLDD